MNILDLAELVVAETKVAVLEDPLMPLRFTWKERFNQHKLKYVIDHLDEYKTKIMSTGHDFKDDNEKWQQQHTQLTKYLNASSNGVIDVSYHQPSPRFGRMFANRSQSLQNITRAVRHTIAGDLYYDIDIENAHPTILAYICKQKGIPTPLLTSYNAQREKVFEAIMKDTGLNRGDVKQLFLSIMNGGESDYNKLVKPNIIVDGFKQECQRIWKGLIFLDPVRYEECKTTRIKAGKNYNHEGSFANKLLCDMENQILAVMVNFFKLAGLVTDTCVLCFDGVMIPRDSKINFGIHLPECSAVIKSALGIDIVLKEKPMAEGLELPADIGAYVELRIEYYNDHSQFAGKEVTVDKLTKWVNNALVYITGGGHSSMYTKNHRIDLKSQEPVVYFEAVSVQGLMETLAINVSIINPDADPEAFKAIEKLEAEGKKVPKALKNKAAMAAKYLPIQTLDKFVQLQKANRTMVHKNSIDFFPYLKRKYPNGFNLGDTFNVFTGFPLDDCIWDKPQTFEQSKFYAHLRDEMFPGDPGELNHFLDFVADMVQQPAQLRPVAHLFYSEQGVGKGMVAAWITSLLGRDHVIEFKNASTYFQKFNNDRMNKILNVFEELSERGECFSQHNQLKADMTSETIRIEFKGGAITHMRNSARYLFNSNNENTLNVEHDNRRMTMHRCSNKRANDRPYFVELWGEIQNKEFATMSFNYMADRKYDEANVMKAYSTAYKREQQIVNLSNPIKFIAQTIESKWEGFPPREDDSPDQRVGSELLWEKYSAWVTVNHLKWMSRPYFMSEIKHLGLDEPSSLTVYGKKQRCFVINDGTVLHNMRQYLRNPEFTFSMVR